MVAPPRWAMLDRRLTRGAIEQYFTAVEGPSAIHAGLYDG